MTGGTGQKFTSATTVIAGVASLAATLLSIVSIWFQLKNYRKPVFQRYVVRILLMVPIYSVSSWSSIVSIRLAFWFTPIRDIYEAFTIYTFFQLLINYLGGERALIIMTHGREPVQHLWPLNHVLPRVDISDPHTFLAIKRGILQYAWLKPILSLAAIIMKATGTYQEGYISLDSGYFWSGIIYNLSVTVSLYALGLFWVCMHNDLKPFRPVPKFLCIKLIIFASYWQGFFLSILVWLGAIPDDVQGYTPDNLAAAIQDFLICLEMPGFAIAHWHAFSWHDFADNRISSARMPVWYAMRDAFGIRDLIEDSKETFKGDKYGYRIFDSGDKIMAHEASRSRLARIKDGMRYERGGKGKYWIPTPNEINQTTPLLGANGGPSSRRNELLSPHGDSPEDPILDQDEELLYAKARKLEYGDWNYPVVTANEPLRDRYHSPHPFYQASPTNSFYRQTESTPVPSLNPSAPLDRRKKLAPEGLQVAAERKKGKQKQRSDAGEAGSSQGAGKDPLEIAYGPIVGTDPVITEDDFEVDTAGGMHHPQPAMDRSGESSPGHGTPVGEEAGQDERSSEHGSEPSPTFSIGGDEDEFRNVWGK
ncbi:organic solute transporter Ostalpha-domain-containing protein [Phialemonium atrogriseum]|uniref:Organic solute transporter Ostalpha-domain-containing protein n=1 Tax=Phialemonium atrogriseum TaxID=1093897 RepID=A0AAJ0FK89_9PEZI|nr:organic solute transporter Ostalpha-domain-containing protein [Phialemonium atrogriseum]KAK1771356.1 organic solute transporter Ostalpha-domain-containing protein [Phialemonium atrogriseum]